MRHVHYVIIKSNQSLAKYIVILIDFSDFLGSQTCVDNPNVNQNGQKFIDTGRQVIIPNARFNCNGRLTNVIVSLFKGTGTNFPLFQVWHPASFNSSTYQKMGEVQLPNTTTDSGKNHYSANLSLDSSSQIEFQSGDVIGYYQPSKAQYRIWNVQTSGYTSYSISVTSPLTSIDISKVDNIDTDHQPLVAVMFGKITHKINPHSN